MRTKNLTPLTFGTSVTSTAPPKPEMVVIVRGRFDIVVDGVATLPACAAGLEALAQGPLSGDVFTEGDDERRRELVYPSDFAPLKPRAEVMFVGSCYAPRGRRMTECPVAVAVGRWRKALRVVGPRVWENVTGRASDAKSFTSMKLGWSRAWGGPFFPANPIGVGPSSDVVPNVETPKEPITSRGRNYTPAGFAPLNPAWGLRAPKVGELYGASYRPRAPYFSEDFDWTYFNAAPPDQHLGSSLRGNEEVVLHNLHPEHTRLSTRLPGLRVRCFVHDVAKVFREVTLMLDTLFIDGDAGQLLLTWRGRTAVADDELEDVTTVLVASEDLAERPDDYEKYQARLLKFEADPLAPDEHLSVDDLDLMRAADEGRGDGLSVLCERESPGIPRELASAPDAGRVDAALSPAPHPGAPGLHQLLDRWEVEKFLPELEDYTSEDARALELAHPRLQAHDPKPPPPGEVAPAAGADLRDRDFTDRDLTGADLTGADLRGAILTRAKLCGARLAGATLAGGVLFEAELTDADLSGAVLDRVNAAKATLERANLTGARIEGAFFGEADCRDACFDQTAGTDLFFTTANLTAASFRGAQLTHADFEHAVIERAVFRGAVLQCCLFHRTRAASASFEDASIDRCSFARADLGGATLEGARGGRCNLTRANLADSDLRYAKLTEGHFSYAIANGARFDCADLSQARFFKAKLVSASFKQANLLSADLSKCTMHEASFEGANLYDAKLVNAAGRNVVLDGANTKRAVHDHT